MATTIARSSASFLEAAVPLVEVSRRPERLMSDYKCGEKVPTTSYRVTITVSMLLVLGYRQFRQI